MRTHLQRDLCKGLLAGAVGGLIASFAMSRFHSLFSTVQPSVEPSEDSTVKTADVVSRKIFHHPLTPQQKVMAGPVVHYAFGASVGMLYGAAVEILPSARTGWGLPFGAAVWLGAH